MVLDESSDIPPNIYSLLLLLTQAQSCKKWVIPENIEKLIIFLIMQSLSTLYNITWFLEGTILHIILYIGVLDISSSSSSSYSFSEIWFLSLGVLIWFILYWDFELLL